MSRLDTAHNAARLPNRHGRDTGSAAEARRFFSQNTRQIADSYGDLGWARVGMNGLGAVLLLAAALGLGRFQESGIVPLALLGVGVIWGGMTLRIAMAKLAAGFQRRPY